MSLSRSNSSAFQPFERKKSITEFTDINDELLQTTGIMTTGIITTGIITTGIKTTETIVNTRKSRRNAFNNIRKMFKFSTFGNIGTKNPIFPK
jgi:hypothetical protein